MEKQPDDIYTLEGLRWLTQELARKETQWDNYSGNNPNKGAADRRALRSQIEVVTALLKTKGVLTYTTEEILNRKLDAQTPSRLKGCCTQLDGQWYKFKLTGKDDRGRWTWKWDAVSAEEVDAPGSYLHTGPKRRAN